MPINAATLKRWVAGASHDAEDVDARNAKIPDDVLEEGDDDVLDEDEDPFEALWDGSDGRTAEELADMDDEEASDFAAWLQEHESDIFDAFLQLAELDPDDPELDATLEMIRDLPQASGEDLFATLDAAQREAAADRIIAAAPGADPERVVARALAAARASVSPEDAEPEDDDEPATTA